MLFTSYVFEFCKETMQKQLQQYGFNEDKIQRISYSINNNNIKKNRKRKKLSQEHFNFQTKLKSK